MVKQVELDNLNLMQKRASLLIGARMRDYKKIQKAARSIERLRRKAPKGWDSVEEIRKWRDKR
ncbi:MAG: hypothetical protein QMD71_03540 [bacterium]|nr:hypothetical protein [bacterium]